MRHGQSSSKPRNLVVKETDQGVFFEPVELRPSGGDDRKFLPGTVGLSMPMAMTTWIEVERKDESPQWGATVKTTAYAALCTAHVGHLATLTQGPPQSPTQQATARYDCYQPPLPPFNIFSVATAFISFTVTCSGVRCGWLLREILPQRHYNEHWMLQPAYQAPDASSGRTVRLDPITPGYAGPAEFLSDMDARRNNAAGWTYAFIDYAFENC